MTAETNILCLFRVHSIMKILVSALLAVELCTWNVAYAQRAFKAFGRLQVQAAIQTVDIGNGIVLHYVDQGKGTPVIFVHGSLSDGGYWADQVGQFAEHYRAIAYSRRHNYPNINPARTGYSAVADAEDLAGFIYALHLGKVVVIGHSYGALAALFLVANHPELVRALVLAEPPAISLLEHLPGDKAKTGEEMFQDIQRRMVTPMQQAFLRGDRSAGIGAFMAYVFNDPHAWDQMTESARDETLRDAPEWDVMMTTGTLFPDIEPGTVKKITAPVLLLSGAKSYPFLGLISEELARLLPNREAITLPNAGHQMWYQAPEVCRKDVETFLGRIGIQPNTINGRGPGYRCRLTAKATCRRVGVV